MIGINNLLSWLENWPRNWTNNKLQAIALKGLFNICLLIEVNHITSQPSLPKKIKSPPWSVLSRWVLGICLQSVLPTKAETFTPLQDRHQCASVVFLVFFCCLFLEAVVWKSEVIVCIHSSRRRWFTYSFLLPLPIPNKQTPFLPATLPLRKAFSFSFNKLIK